MKTIRKPNSTLPPTGYRHPDVGRRFRYTHTDTKTSFTVLWRGCSCDKEFRSHGFTFPQECETVRIVRSSSLPESTYWVPSDGKDDLITWLDEPRAAT